MALLDRAEKEVELAWKSRQFDLSRLSKTRTHFGPLGALPPKEPPTEDPALRYVNRACNRPILLPEVPEPPPRLVRKVQSAGELRPNASPGAADFSRPGTTPVSKDAGASQTRLPLRAEDKRVLRYQKLITLYESAMLGQGPPPPRMTRRLRKL
mmetsp:Transcript_93/g.275  ORF Transcript_93/g.275 Transcript_93/m.275 type:complete len:154 (-) Transcript_93:28-489(-)